MSEFGMVLPKKADPRSVRLMQMPGIGPITASALLAAIGNGHDFKCGRQLAAWLGLVPGQYGMGGNVRLGYITKAGDPYLAHAADPGRALGVGLGQQQDRSPEPLGVVGA